jgi:ABC-2 type transport system permease protein
MTIVTCLSLVLVGTPWVLGFFSGWTSSVLVDAIASLSFYTHFNSISRGVIDLKDVVFFALLISAALYANTIILRLTKAE